jgi:hypothetical protein
LCSEVANTNYQEELIFNEPKKKGKTMNQIITLNNTKKATLKSTLYKIGALLIILATQPSWGMVNREFTFKYQLKDAAFDIKIQANNKSEAYELAAQECFNHLTGARGLAKVKLSEEKTLDIVDTCANPKYL